MINLYTAIVFITIFVLCITIADVFTNRLITNKMKRKSIVVCLIIGGAILCEWIGVKTNGASVSLIWLHRYAKAVEFCLTPASGVSAAIAYGEAKRPKTAIGIIIVHAVFEFAGLYNGWVFSIDEANIYHREGLYWIYIAVFSLAAIYCFVCIVKYGKKYQARFDVVLILTLCLLVVGIGVQMINSEIRVDFMCVAIGNSLLYNHYCKAILQVDALTRLMNRRCYEHNIENIKPKAAVLIFDINKFKRINDTFGHAAGDRCLRLIAERIYGVYGKYGFCYRIGGDEFCVILNKNLDDLQKLNSRFRDEVANLCERERAVSDVALGYAYYDRDKTDIALVIEEADNMMYKNKKQ